MVLDIASAVLFGGGLLCMVMCVLSSVVELVTLRRISAPPPRTFSRMVARATHWQTIALPAMGALLASWLVSLSASFVFVSFTADPGGWQSAVGVGLLIVALVLLAVTLNFALRRVGDPADLLHDPWAIHAAAQESAAGVPGSVGPDELRASLDRWLSVRSARSLGVTRDVRSPFLDAVFEASRAKGSGRRSDTWRRACVIYLAAAARLPWSFAWPLAGVLAAEVGLGMALVGQGLVPWQVALTLLALLVASILLVLFHAIVLGLRALRLDALHEGAVNEASEAVAEAEAAGASLVADHVGNGRFLLRIGPVVISTTRAAPWSRGL